MGLTPSKDECSDVGRGAAEVYASYGCAACPGPLPTSPPPTPPSGLHHHLSDQPSTFKRRREYDQDPHRHRNPHARIDSEDPENDLQRDRETGTDADTDPDADTGPASVDDAGTSLHGGVTTAHSRTASSFGPRSSTAMRPQVEPPDLVPVVFTWNFGGTHVYVIGAWDGWREKSQMSRDGSSFIAVLYLPYGQTYQFKYFVDENWQCNPSLPTQTDAQGNTNNVVAVTEPDLEYDSSAPLALRSPPSPISSYSQSVIEADETLADPPSLPDAMAATPVVLPPRSHVLIDHLHLCHSSTDVSQSDPNGYTSAPPVALASCYRYKEKVISATFVLCTSNPSSSSRSHFVTVREASSRNIPQFTL